MSKHCANSHNGPNTQFCPLCGESMSPFLNEARIANFETLRRAMRNGDVALMECTNRKTGELTAVIVAVQRGDDNTIDTIPLGLLFDGDPYEDYLPPDSPKVETRKPT